MTDFEIFIKKNKLKKKDVAEFIGVSSAFITQLTQGTRDIPLDKLALIKANISWDTTMFDDEKPKYNEAVFIKNANVMMLPVVSQYAYAGYTHGYADAEYIESLPKMPFYADHEAKGNYMGFEVKGDSMDDGTKNSIEEGDMLACREIKRNLWQYKLHLNKWFFVIVHKTEGILVKQITDHNLETGIITIHSLNRFYEDRKLNINDVAQIFNVVQILRTPRL